jgi:hypothetical protein
MFKLSNASKSAAQIQAAKNHRSNIKFMNFPKLLTARKAAVKNMKNTNELLPELISAIAVYLLSLVNPLFALAALIVLFAIWLKEPKPN